MRSGVLEGFVRLEKLTELGGHSNRIEALVAKRLDLVLYPGFNR